MPDLNSLSAENVLEFLKAEDFNEFNAGSILGSDDRNAAYTNAVRSRLINQAGAAVSTANDVLQKQCVFVPRALSVQFEAAIAVLKEVCVELYMAHRSPEIRGLGANKAMSLKGIEGTAMFESLRDVVRDRLLRALDEDRKADSEIRPDRPANG